jgi:multisubunit Na+/H+ antiporter MnhG subunit
MFSPETVHRLLLIASVIVSVVSILAGIATALPPDQFSRDQQSTKDTVCYFLRGVTIALLFFVFSGILFLVVNLSCSVLAKLITPLFTGAVH